MLRDNFSIHKCISFAFMFFFFGINNVATAQEVLEDQLIKKYDEKGEVYRYYAPRNDKPFNGYIISLYPDSTLHTKIQYKKGLKHGDEMYYSESGELLYHAENKKDELVRIIHGSMDFMQDTVKVEPKPPLSEKFRDSIHVDIVRHGDSAVTVMVVNKGYNALFMDTVNWFYLPVDSVMNVGFRDVVDESIKSVYPLVSGDSLTLEIPWSSEYNQLVFSLEFIPEDQYATRIKQLDQGRLTFDSIEFKTIALYLDYLMEW